MGIYETTAAATEETWTKGEKQEAKCNDIPFAILFYINIIVISFVAIVLGSSEVDLSGSESDEKYPYDKLVQAAVVLSAVGGALSVVIFFILISFANILIKMALFFSAGMSLVGAAVMFYIGGPMGAIGGVFCLLGFALNCCYAYCVWSRIPFATANLVTATQSIQANCGVTIVAYGGVLLACVWSLLWTMAFIGLDAKYEINNSERGNAEYGVSCVMLLSFYFTHQVLTNTVHVIVAGVVGTWWFTPLESGCCSNAVFGSMFRAVTSAFGSICMGSLLVAIIQTLETMARQARENGDDCQALLCIVECILSCIEDIVRYFNKWAYIYVGLYGYSYIEAGKNVIRLFQSRGWETIIADDLVGGVLNMVSFMGGLCTAVVGYVLYNDVVISADTEPWVAGLIAAVLGFLIGLVVISITMSVIASAVNTVIVCFADAPSEFQSNHPELSNKMRAAWLGAYPDSFS